MVPFHEAHKSKCVTFEFFAIKNPLEIFFLIDFAAFLLIETNNVYKTKL